MYKFHVSIAACWGHMYAANKFQSSSVKIIFISGLQQHMEKKKVAGDQKALWINNVCMCEKDEEKD